MYTTCTSYEMRDMSKGTFGPPNTSVISNYEFNAFPESNLGPYLSYKRPYPCHNYQHSIFLPRDSATQKKRDHL